MFQVIAIVMKILCSADHIAVQDQTTWAPKIVSMIRKYHSHKLQTNPWHSEEEQHNTHKTPGRQAKQSHQLSLFPIKVDYMTIQETPDIPSVAL